MLALIVWNAESVAIAFVIALAIVGLVIIAARVFGVPIPSWFWHVLGICVACAIIVAAIRFVASL